MRKALLRLALLVVPAFVTLTAYASTPDFYKGKTIRVVVGHPAGDLYDLWARLVAQHMGKHIPGNPNLIVQNMPGAASMIATNYVYTVGKSLGFIGVTSIKSYFCGQRREAGERPIDGVTCDVVYKGDPAFLTSFGLSH